MDKCLSSKELVLWVSDGVYVRRFKRDNFGTRLKILYGLLQGNKMGETAQC